jgi:hypothetical protein
MRPVTFESARPLDTDHMPWIPCREHGVRPSEQILADPQTANGGGQ